MKFWEKVLWIIRITILIFVIFISIFQPVYFLACVFVYFSTFCTSNIFISWNNKKDDSFCLNNSSNFFLLLVFFDCYYKFSPKNLRKTFRSDIYHWKNVYGLHPWFTFWIRFFFNLFSAVSASFWMCPVHNGWNWLSAGRSGSPARSGKNSSCSEEFSQGNYFHLFKSQILLLFEHYCSLVYIWIKLVTL